MRVGILVLQDEEDVKIIYLVSVVVTTSMLCLCWSTKTFADLLVKTVLAALAIVGMVLVLTQQPVG